MFSIRVPTRRGGRDEAEKPFWISFADLMTSLMVLFLVTMTVALLAASKTQSDEEKAQKAREDAIEQVREMIREAVRNTPGFQFQNDTITMVNDNLGPQAQFDFGKHALRAQDARKLRQLAPGLLRAANSEAGRRWLRRFVIEGFTDEVGGYLRNLNLSLMRSERALCALLAPPGTDETPLTPNELRTIRERFLVGGFSFNSLKASAEESRRIELRVEFRDLKERLDARPLVVSGDHEACPI
jgi:outer membrane protein OmpA-like peptidoglycan-associated protein